MNEAQVFPISPPEMRPARVPGVLDNPFRSEAMKAHMALQEARNAADYYRQRTEQLSAALDRAHRSLQVSKDVVYGYRKASELSLAENTKLRAELDKRDRRGAVLLLVSLFFLSAVAAKFVVDAIF